ncbi:hypothetical protein RHMOL_Rhmol09G0056000 [Rhododendron molle]|uniref:Uncharacterized protein n=1 Tax=Rhododendron molle TaxID=49168 RepID=A0ACC0MBB9_RHOML|nr:hypothetical protein RHMOL_Rhmol09G0056000 [Rhododendron molle]
MCHVIVIQNSFFLMGRATQATWDTQCDAPSYATKYGTRRKHLPIFPNFMPHRNKLEPIYAFFSKFTKLIKQSSLNGSINYCG